MGKSSIHCVDFFVKGEEGDPADCMKFLGDFFIVEPGIAYGPPVFLAPFWTVLALGLVRYYPLEAAVPVR